MSIPLVAWWIRMQTGYVVRAATEGDNTRWTRGITYLEEKDKNKVVRCYYRVGLAFIQRENKQFIWQVDCTFIIIRLAIQNNSCKWINSHSPSFIPPGSWTVLNPDGWWNVSNGVLGGNIQVILGCVCPHTGVCLSLKLNKTVNDMRKNLCCHWEKHNLIQAAPRQWILISRHVGKHGLSVRLADTPLASTWGLKPKDLVPSMDPHRACRYVPTHRGTHPNGNY